MHTQLISDVVSTLGRGTPTVWAILGIVAAAGALGGLFNGLLSDSGVALPGMDETSHIFKLGIVGNILIGAFAAVLTWGMYGPLKDAVLVGPHPAGEVSATLTVTAFIGAMLAGAGGARVVTGEIDKRFLRSAAADAAKSQPNTDLAKTILTGTPAAAADAAKRAAA